MTGIAPNSLLLLVLVVELSGGDHSPGCELFYHHRCYEYSDHPVSSRQATSACVEIGGALANIRNRQIKNFLTQLLEEQSQKKDNAESVWIGRVFHLDEWMKKDKEVDAKCGLTLDKKGKVSLKTSVSLFFPCGDHEVHYALCEREGKGCKFRDVHIAHGHISCTSLRTLKPTGKARVICKKGYVLHGPSSIECLLNGTWTEPPSCIPGCTLSSIPKGINVLNAKTSYRVGEKAMLFCDDGFFPHGSYPMTHLQTTCLKDNTWAGAPFTCVPFLRLGYSYSLQAESTMAVAEGADTELECQLDGTYDPHYVHWTKDQKSITSLEEETHQGTKYQVTSRGHLQIAQFQESDVGRYTCSALDANEEQHIFITYDVQLKRTCSSQVTSTSSTTLQEGDTALLECGEASPDASIKWLKEGHMIWGDDRRIITENGDLLIQAVAMNDAGLYICIAEEAPDDCRDNTNVTIIRLNLQIQSVKSICGLEKWDDHSEGDNSPWFVSLWRPDANTLTGYGTLIDRQWVLTSASAVVGVQTRQSTNLNVKLGAKKTLSSKTENTIISIVSKNDYFDTNNPFGSQVGSTITIPVGSPVFKQTLILPQPPPPTNHEQTMAVERVVLHPEFDSKIHINDIALLKLEEPLNISHTARPICLPSKELLDMMDLECDENAPVRNGYTTRLGPVSIFQNETGPVSQAMHILRQGRCQNSVQLPLPSSVFCASEESNARKPTVLSGDDGSPFDIEWNHRTYVWGIHTHKGFYFDFYTAVAPFLSWIEDITGIS